MCEDQTNEELVVSDQVIILGTITSISQAGSQCVVTVEVEQQGGTVGLIFYSGELIKATIDDHTVTGVVSGPTG